jgi:hypothetical protein
MGEAKTALDRFVWLKMYEGNLTANNYLDAIPADAPEQIAALKKRLTLAEAQSEKRRLVIEKLAGEQTYPFGRVEVLTGQVEEERADRQRWQRRVEKAILDKRLAMANRDKARGKVSGLKADITHARTAAKNEAKRRKIAERYAMAGKALVDALKHYDCKVPWVDECPNYCAGRGAQPEDCRAYVAHNELAKYREAVK